MKLIIFLCLVINGMSDRNILQEPDPTTQAPSPISTLLILSIPLPTNCTLENNKFRGIPDNCQYPIIAINNYNSICSQKLIDNNLACNNNDNEVYVIFNLYLECGNIYPTNPFPIDTYTIKYKNYRYINIINDIKIREYVYNRYNSTFERTSNITISAVRILGKNKYIEVKYYIKNSDVLIVEQGNANTTVPILIPTPSIIYPIYFNTTQSTNFTGSYNASVMNFGVNQIKFNNFKVTGEMQFDLGTNINNHNGSYTGQFTSCIQEGYLFCYDFTSSTLATKLKYNNKEYNAVKWSIIN